MTHAWQSACRTISAQRAGINAVVSEPSCLSVAGPGTAARQVPQDARSFHVVHVTAEMAPIAKVTAKYSPRNTHLR